MGEQLKNKDVKIRKEQRCFSCWRKFPPGTTMNYWAGVYEGDFCAVYSCITCQGIMRYQEPGEEGGYPEFFVAYQLRDGQTPEDLLQELNDKSAA